MATDDETAWKPSLEYLRWLIPGARSAVVAKVRTVPAEAPAVIKLEGEPEGIAPY